MSTSQKLNVIPVKEFASSKNFISISPTVRTNTNNYPYLTFIDKDNKAENIYFSKESAKLVGVGQVVDKQMLTSFMIAETKNAAGELRIKLVSNSQRVSLEDLLS